MKTLRELRRELGLNQSEFGKKLGWSVSETSLYETGKFYYG